MAVKRTIPGQLREEEMRAIELLAQLVPPNGHIVEVGSLLGLSSWIWAKNAPPGVTVHCMDPWELAGGGNFQKLASSHRQTFTRAQFLENVKDCQNIVAHMGFSPNDFLKWDTPVDLYFEDAVHQDPILSENLQFWSSRLTPQGIICGHDYVDKFPDVRRGSRLLAASLGRTLRVIGSLWFALPASVESKRSGQGEIVDRLLALEAEYRPQALIEKDDIGEAVEMLNSEHPWVGEVTLSGAERIGDTSGLQIAGFLKNRSDKRIVSKLNDTVFAEIGYEVFLKGKKTQVGRVPITAPEIRAGQTYSFEFEIHPNTPPASIVKVGLLYRHAMWLDRKGISSVEATVQQLVEDGQGSAKGRLLT